MAGNTKGVAARSVGILCLFAVRKGEGITVSAARNGVLKPGIHFALSD
ncbi:hypothetical protein ED5_2587 [Enterobacter roggenkampii]|nr:hypothetical protein ED5_2587 [Enterobacter roggenkampii]